LIQPKDYEEGFRTENKTQETIGKKGFLGNLVDFVNTK